MTNTLAQHYSIPKLLRFTLPTILVMVFTSIYGVVDGYFLSSVAGKTAFAAVNFIMPVLMILASFGFMMGAGSSALVGKTLGEQNPQKARKQMTSLLAATVILGMILSVLGLVFLRPLLEWMNWQRTDDALRFAVRIHSSAFSSALHDSDVLSEHLRNRRNSAGRIRGHVYGRHAQHCAGRSFCGRSGLGCSWCSDRHCPWTAALRFQSSAFFLPRKNRFV